MRMRGKQSFERNASPDQVVLQPVKKIWSLSHLPTALEVEVSESDHEVNIIGCLEEIIFVLNCQQRVSISKTTVTCFWSIRFLFIEHKT